VQKSSYPHPRLPAPDVPSILAEMAEIAPARWPPVGTLLERERELSAVDRALDALRRGQGGIVIVEGPPGIGKTAVLRESCRRAAARDVRILRAAGSELERDYAYGIVHQLLGPELARRDAAGREALFAGAAAPARGVLAAGAAPPAAVDRRFAVLNALFWLLVTVADGAPTLVVVDDLHWADDASAHFLEFLSHRTGNLALLCLAARRPPEPDDDAARTLAAGDGTTVVRPPPLSVAAAGALLPGGDGAFVRACHTVSRGNPLLLDTLRRWVASGDLAPDAAAIARLSESGVPAADALLERMRPRAEAGRLAEAVAVLGDNGRLVDAAALADLSPEAAAAALDALVLGGILVAEPPAFVHPLVLAAIRDAIAPARRAALHARAARLVAAAGAPPAAVATHLLRASPAGDPWAVEWLRRAATAASEAGAMDGAILLLRRAQAEPPPEEQRAEVSLELGIAEARANDPHAIADLDAAAESDAPWIRTAATVAKGRLLVFLGKGDEAVAALGALVGTVDQRELALLAEAELIDAAWSPHTLPLRQEALDRFEALARPDDGTYPVLPVSRAFDLAATSGAAPEVERLLLPVVEGHRLLRAIGPDSPIVYLAINALGLIERADLAVLLADATLAAARARGSRFASGYLLTYRSVLELRFGSVARAVAEARAGHEVVIEQSFALGAGLAAAMLAEALVEQGDLAGAQAAVAAAPAPEHTPDNPFTPFVLGARGHLLLAAGRPEQALADLTAAGDAMGARGWNTPGLVAWRSHAARALLTLDRPREARALAEEELALARQAGPPRAVAVALVALAVADARRRRALLEEAVALLAPTPARLAHARALVALGHDRLAAGDRAGARTTFALALDQAYACQAQAVQAQARGGLRGAGGRPRRARVTGPESLTASERRVADLAADGATNRAIAEALFVTTKTVETHLSSVYGKLAIGSRHQLAAALRSHPELRP
jgi:DNA-binding NarL/FixJ family response regulator